MKIDSRQRFERTIQLNSKKYGVSCVYGMPVSQTIMLHIMDIIQVLKKNGKSFVPRVDLTSFHATLVRCKGLDKTNLDFNLILSFYSDLLEDFEGFNIYGITPSINEDGAVRCECESDFLNTGLCDRFDRLMDRYSLSYIRLPKKIWINIGEFYGDISDQTIVKDIGYVALNQTQHISEVKLVYFNDIGFKNYNIIKKYTSP